MDQGGGIFGGAYSVVVDYLEETRFLSENYIFGATAAVAATCALTSLVPMPNQKPKVELFCCPVQLVGHVLNAVSLVYIIIIIIWRRKRKET